MSTKIALALVAVVVLCFFLWEHTSVIGEGRISLPTASGPQRDPGSDRLAPPPLTLPRLRSSTATTYTTYLPIVAQNHPPLPYVLTTIALPAGSHPHGIALDIDGRRAFVGNHGADTLAVIDTVSMTLLSTVPLTDADGPNGVAYNPETDLVYVANRNSDNLSVVNPTTVEFLGNISVGHMPDGVEVMVDRIYVANFGSDTVSVLNATTNQPIRTLPAGIRPALMARSEESASVYLAAHGSNSVHRLYKDHSNQDTIASMQYGSVPAPYGLGFDAVSYRLYVANRAGDPTVTLIDVNPNHLMGAIDVGREPFVVGVNPRTGHVFVVCGDQVAVYDRRDNALVVTIPVGGGAEEGVAVDPARNLVYVTNGDTDEVTVIQDIPTTDVVYISQEGTQAQLIISDDRGWHFRSLTEGPSIQTPSWRPQPNNPQPPSSWLLLFAAYDLVVPPAPEPPYQGWDIWRVEPGGSNLVNVTRPSTNPDGLAHEDVEPAWSPDGSQIAWRRDWSIWVMDTDGYNKQELTTGISGARTPRWSPDGGWIAFVAPIGAEENLFMVSADGSQVVTLTNEAGYGVLEPSWSPDGREIAFETDRDGNWEIYKVNVENPETPVLTRLTTDSADDRYAVWSPDGTQIAFISDRGNPASEYNVYVMEPDGTDQRRLSILQPVQLLAAWSPDGHRLAFQLGQGDIAELYLVDVETGEAARLTSNSAEDRQPAWRPEPW
jgi:YVTN family beta-propeller protein